LFDCFADQKHFGVREIVHPSNVADSATWDDICFEMTLGIIDTITTDLRFNVTAIDAWF
jgi:hypothetical protein